MKPIDSELPNNPGDPVDIQRMERQIRCLRRFGVRLESTMGRDEVLTLTVEQITELMEAERSSLFVKDDAGDFISYVLEGEGISKIRLNPGQGIAGWVAGAGKPLSVPDVTKDDRFDSSFDNESGYETRCVICHPIRSGENRDIIGVIEVMNKKGHVPFDDADMELLSLLSGRVALIVENLQLMVDLVEKNRSLIDAKDTLERRNRELNLLIGLEKRAARCDDVGALVVSILKRLIDITGARVGMSYLPDENGAELRVVKDNEDGCGVNRVAPGTGFIGWVAAKGKELVLDVTKSDPRHSEEITDGLGFDLESIASLPLPSKEEATPSGAILVANKRSGVGFKEPDMVLLRLVAARLNEAIEECRGRDKRERDVRLAAIGRLLAGVLHDLKSPMAVITGYAELLEASSTDKESKDYLERIQAALGRITTMSSEIIAFSRGERSLLLSNVLIDDVVRDFIKSIEHILEANQIKLVTQVRLSGAVKVDKHKLIRAFQNIVQNSVDSMEEGGTLTVEVDQLGDELVIGFTDTGSGIADEVRGSLFQSFVTLGKEHGTGLGLAVAREIIEAHHGLISYTTVRGKGTTFLISIPAN